MRKYQRFSKEQKQEIVTEALNGQLSKGAVARKHGISHSLLANWMKAYEGGALDNEPTSEAGAQAKIGQLEQMIGRQAMEIEFLKKAIAYGHALQKKKEHLSKNTGTLSDQLKGDAS